MTSFSNSIICSTEKTGCVSQLTSSLGGVSSSSSSESSSSIPLLFASSSLCTSDLTWIRKLIIVSYELKF